MGANGKILLVGDSGIPSVVDGSATVYLYNKKTFSWEEYQTFTGEGPWKGFGIAVDVSRDGKSLYITSPQYDNGAGAVWNFDLEVRFMHAYPVSFDDTSEEKGSSFFFVTCSSPTHSAYRELLTERYSRMSRSMKTIKKMK